MVVSYGQVQSPSRGRSRTEVGEQSQLQAAGGLEPGIEGVPRRYRRIGDERRAARDQLGRCRRAIRYLEGNPDVASNPTANLNVVNKGRVSRIGQLDGRLSGLENRHTSVRGGERCVLGQTEHVTVKAKRAS
jgi:hypothetical protein